MPVAVVDVTEIVVSISSGITSIVSLPSCETSAVMLRTSFADTFFASAPVNETDNTLLSL